MQKYQTIFETLEKLAQIKQKEHFLTFQEENETNQYLA